MNNVTVALHAGNYLCRSIIWLDVDSRSQCDRQDLEAVSQYLNIVCGHLTKIADFSGDLIFINSARSSLQELISDSTFVETDSATKEYLVDRLLKAKEEYLNDLGRYILDKDFNYDTNFKSLLQEVISIGISRGNCFGFTIEEIRKELIND